nr:AbiV family abortive infection protein [Microbacterium testaceum]
MAVRRLPDLTPLQVVRLQDALLANANTLLTSALALLDLGHVALARSLAILGLEESGKAIAVHERRVEMCYIADGEPFRCDRLDELWGSHEKKLEAVHRFLVEERYWFGVEPSDPDENAAYLGTIRSWARRHDRSKQRGLYVDLGKTGEVMAPSDLSDDAALREVIAHVHQIGWQLRLGEHIEGKRQDETEAGLPPLNDDDLAWLAVDEKEELDDVAKEFRADLQRSMKEGVPGESLPNAAYRFNPPDADRSPFRNVGRPGYEAETRELMRLAHYLRQEDDEQA